MSTYKVFLQFSGSVDVQVADGVPPAVRAALATKIAVARVQAVLDNPDAPEDAACESLAIEHDLDEEQAGEWWDNTEVTGLLGCWHAAETKEMP